jgi:dihydrolipoamide dehydrogenase
LLHAGEVADLARESEQFGIRASFDGVDMKSVNAYRTGSSRTCTRACRPDQVPRVASVEGTGRLVAPTAVDVDGSRYTGRNVVLATGSYSRSLPGLEIDGERVITSDHALNLDRVPASVVVLGGGIIGCEFASAWRSFGAEVTIVEALPRLLATEDVESSRRLERAFRKRGIVSKTGKPFAGVSTSDSGVAVTIEGGETIQAELMLVAVGRGPTTANLGYEEQGVVLDRASFPPTSDFAPTCPTCTRSATSCPASSSRTAVSSTASSSRRRSRGSTRRSSTRWASPG